MSLKKENKQTSFFDTNYLCSELLDEKDFYYIFREEIYPLLKDEDFKDMYSDKGRNANSPKLNMYTMILQLNEHIPDRAAARNVVFRLDWKYALNLEVDYKGFHFSNLSNFRKRLIENEAEGMVFERFIKELEEKGFIKRSGKQRIDATKILGHIDDISKYECIGESMRITLLYLKKNHEEVYKKIEKKLREKYSKKISDFRMTESEKARKFKKIGEDYLLIKRIIEKNKLNETKSEIKRFNKIFSENFDIVNGKAEKTKRKVKKKICSPHDPEVNIGKHGAKTWKGYKMQILETAEEGGENFILHVEATPSTEHDSVALERILDKEIETEKAPEKIYGDSAYITGDTIQKARDKGIELMGPMKKESSKGNKFKQEKFEINLETKIAVCPGNKKSKRFSHGKDRHGRPELILYFGEQCQTCPLKNKCTENKRGRTLKIPYHFNLIRERRVLQKTKEFKKEMYNRNAIEGTISELVRKHGIRTARYVGIIKTNLQLIFSALALNVKRFIKIIIKRITLGEISPETQ